MYERELARFSVAHDNDIWNLHELPCKNKHTSGWRGGKTTFKLFKRTPIANDISFSRSFFRCFVIREVLRKILVVIWM